ncbi:THAP7 protein, partial [Pandion haliaetus]|nr:THAP7 protein [Pandion haliaetus]
VSPPCPRLPKKDNPRRALWLENSRRRDASGGGRWGPASKYIYFCSQHFEKSCFEIVGFRTLGVMAHPKIPSTKAFGRTLHPPSAFSGPTDLPLELWGTPGTLPKVLGPPPGTWELWSTQGLLEDPRPVSPQGFRVSKRPCRLLLVATGDEEATATPALPEGDPPAPPRPVSPSLYMLRLPPPAGAYIQSEHSYQVGSALLWKR